MGMNQFVCGKKLYMYILCIYHMTFIRNIILMCIYTYIYTCVYFRYYFIYFLRYVSWKGVVFSFHWGTPHDTIYFTRHPGNSFPKAKSHAPTLSCYSIPSSLAWWFSSKGCNFYWFHCFNKKSLEIGGASLPGIILGERQENRFTAQIHWIVELVSS